MIFDLEDVKPKIKLLEKVYSSNKTDGCYGIIHKCGKLTAFNGVVKLSADVLSRSTDELVIPDKIVKLLEAIDGVADISIKGNVGTLKHGKSRTKFATMNINDVFTIDDAICEDEICFNANDFQKAVKSVLYACADIKSLKPLYTGVKLAKCGTECQFIALDGFRTACANICSNSESDIDVIIPKEALNIVLSLPTKQDDEITIAKSTDGKQIVIKFNDYTLQSKLLVGEFLDIKKLLFDDVIKITIDTGEMQNILSKAMIFGGAKSLVIFDTDETERLGISSTSADGEYTDEIIVGEKLGKIKIGFNAKYLSEALKSYEQETVTFAMPKNPMSLLRIENSDQMSLILPVRIKGVSI